MITPRHFAVWVCLVALASVSFAAEPAETPAASEPSQEELFKKLSETLSNATLVGQFTVEGMNDGKPLAQDRYELGEVKKLPKDDLWSFQARIKYGKNDVKLTFALPIKWAGDTPVISVTNVAFPGLGTYSARVVIYDNQYAGTWGGKDHGGLMFGRIVKGDEAQAEAAKDEKPDDAAEKSSEK